MTCSTAWLGKAGNAGARMPSREPLPIHHSNVAGPYNLFEKGGLEGRSPSKRLFSGRSPPY